MCFVINQLDVCRLPSLNSPPQFKVVSLMVANNTGRDPLNFKQNDPADRLNFTLSLDLTMDVSFYNDNRYDISVEEIDLSVSLFFRLAVTKRQ